MRQLNQFFRKYFGLEIHRTGLNFIKKLRLQKDDPILIEFIGASGVGKTTLFKELIKKRNNRKWLTALEFESFYNDRINKRILENMPEHNLLAERKMDNILKNIIYKLPTTKLGKLRFNYIALLLDAVVWKNNKEYKVVSEEGLFQIFTDEILVLRKEKPEIVKNLMKNRGFVYCFTEPNQLAKQIIKREKQTGHRRLEHQTKSFEELIQKQIEELKKKELLTTILKEYQVPMVIIDGKESLKTNVNKIDHFIQTL